MMKSILLWKDIILSPRTGFPRIDRETKILLPLIIIVLLTVLSTTLLLPIMRSGEYGEALIRVQVSEMEKKGTPMSREQVDAMSRQLSSPQVRTITTISSLVGGAVGYIIMLVVTWLILKLIMIIAKAEAPMGTLFKIMVYLALISSVQALLKNIITVSGNWERIMRLVQTKEDLQMALSSPISLASLVSYKKTGAPVYFIIDAVTDIFNYIYYIYLCLALRWTLKTDKRKAVIVTVTGAVVFIGIGLLTSLLAS